MGITSVVAYFKQVVESGVNIRNRLFLLAILILFLASTLPFLTIFPPVDNVGDESWMTSISLELLKTGSPIASIHAGTPIGEKAQVITMWIYSGVLSLFFFIFGASLWTGRILSLACGLVVVLLTYRIGCKMVNPKVGLSSSFLLITSIAFSWHSREIRPDMMLMAFCVTSIYFFYLAVKEKKNKYFFLSGLISTLSVQAHPNGSFFAISIVIIYLIIFRKTLISGASLYLFIGFFIGFALWMIFNYLPYSTASFQVSHKKYLPPILNSDFLRGESILYTLKGSFKFLWLLLPRNLEMLRLQYYSSIPIGIAYATLFFIIASVIFGRNRTSIFFLLSFIFLPLVIGSFLIGSWQWFHYSVFLPFAFIILSIAVFDVSEVFSHESLKKWIFIGLITFIGAFGLVDIMRTNISMLKYDYNKAVREKIMKNVPKGATLMGTPLYYFALLENNNRFVTYLFLEERCPSFKSEIKKYGIDYILVDESMEYMASLWCSDSYYKNEIVNFIENRTYKEKVIKIEYPSSRTPDRLLHEVYFYKVKP